MVARQKSKRQVRREVAERRIPDLVKDIQLKLDLQDKSIEPRDVELLYNELRQFHGCPRSIPRDVAVLDTVWATGYETWSTTLVLGALSGTFSLDREDLVLLSAELWHRFGTSQLEKPEEPESATWPRVKQCALA